MDLLEGEGSFPQVFCSVNDFIKSLLYVPLDLKWRLVLGAIFSFSKPRSPSPLYLPDAASPHFLQPVICSQCK